MKQKNLFKHPLFNAFFKIYPPFLGASIRPTRIEKDGNVSYKVTMPLNRLNKNFVGTHFGGSLYAMCDPFFMLILFEKYSDKYLVWDKAGSIEYVKPGKGKVTAHFEISSEKYREIEEKVESEKRYIFDLEAKVKDEEGEVVATFTRTIWMKKKERGA